MDRINLPSDEIKSAGYDPKKKSLEVELTQGDVIKYFDVPEGVYARFLNAKSHGSYYLNKIKYIYHYEHIGG